MSAEVKFPHCRHNLGVVREGQAIVVVNTFCKMKTPLAAHIIDYKSVIDSFGSMLDSIAYRIIYIHVA
jgi:hypothetical protein